MLLEKFKQKPDKVALLTSMTELLQLTVSSQVQTELTAGSAGEDAAVWRTGSREV